MNKDNIMKMSINDALIRYNLLNNVKYVDEDYSLSRELKVKLIRLKLDLEKTYNDFNTFQQKALEEVKTPRYNELLANENRSDEENAELQTVINEINEDLNKIVLKKAEEEVNVNFTYLTNDEYNEFLSVNINNEVTINGVKLSAEEYVSLFYHKFVK